LPLTENSEPAEPRFWDVTFKNNLRIPFAAVRFCSVVETWA